MLRRHTLFANLGTEGWQNLGFLAIVVFYSINLIWTLFEGGLFNDTLGADFLCFWTAGRIANELGYANAYDASTLAAASQNITQLNGQITLFSPLPAPVLPVFLVPFQFISFLSPGTGFLVWTLINILAFLLYSVFFLNQLEISKSKRLTFLAFISFPVFYNIFCGQVNIWLMLFVGEFTRHSIQQRKVEAGVWLGGLLLKPQLIVLIIPLLLLRREWKTIIGFTFSSFSLLLLSLWLGGLASIVNLMDLWKHFYPRLAGNMINWRMIGERIQGLGYPLEGWTIASTGIVITIGVLGLFWIRFKHEEREEVAIGYFGTIAATLAVTWHAHIHMAMVLVPLVLYLHGRRLLPDKLFNVYVYVTPVAIIILSLPVKLLGWENYNALMGLIALCTLLINIMMLHWAKQQIDNSIFLKANN